MGETTLPKTRKFVSNKWYVDISHIQEPQADYWYIIIDRQMTEECRVRTQRDEQKNKLITVQIPNMPQPDNHSVKYSIQLTFSISVQCNI